MKQLDPRAVWLFFVSYISRALLVIVLLLFFSFLDSLGEARTGSSASIPPGWTAGIVAFIVIISYVWAKLSCQYYRYELTGNGFRKEMGVIYKKYVTIPYDRIQNVDIYRGIMARILGLSDLQIQTAGSSTVTSIWGATGRGSEGRLPALSREIAEQVRDELIRRAKQRTSQGL